MKKPSLSAIKEISAKARRLERIIEAIGMVYSEYYGIPCNSKESIIRASVIPYKGEYRIGFEQCFKNCASEIVFSFDITPEIILEYMRYNNLEI